MQAATFGALAMASIPAAGAQPHQDDGRNALFLVCDGEGSRPGGTQTRYGSEWNPDKKKYETRSIIEQGQQQFDTQVRIDLYGDRGRIHLTDKLVPLINSGGQDGWWPIKDLMVGRDRITGKYRMNGLNSPKIDIDRRSGRIRIDGIEHFKGMCEVGNGDSGNRF